MAITLSGLMSGCARKPLAERAKAMREASAPKLDDDLPLEPLLAGVEAQAAVIERNPGYATFTFGPRQLTKAEMLAGLRRFVELGRKAPSKDEFLASVAREFDFYEVYGQKSWGEAFMTSYYEPVIEGALAPTGRFTQPLYREPEDLLQLDLSNFDEKFLGERKYRARLIGNRIYPYFSREEIDSAEAFKGRGLEICWVDPIDAFVMQIQGSGTVELGEGKRVRLGYAEKNGQRYESLARHLSGVIPKEKMSLQAIEAHLRSLPLAEMQRILNLNPSYVFFKVLGAAQTTEPVVETEPGAAAASPQPSPSPAPPVALSSLELQEVLTRFIEGKSILRKPDPLELLLTAATPQPSLAPDVTQAQPTSVPQAVAQATASTGPRPPTSMGVAATDGRTIATDARFFPKGAIAFWIGKKPVFESAEAVFATGTEPFRRFVLDQDVGGAITGGGRLDLFWGSGNEAKRFAGAMKEWGTLYYLVPRAPRP